MEPNFAQITDLLLDNFFNRSDIVAVQDSNGRICPAEPEKIWPAIRAHVMGDKVPPARYGLRTRTEIEYVQGHYRMGTYCPAPNGTTKFAYYDIDGGNQKEGTIIPDAMAVNLYHHLQDLGFNPYLEKPGSGGGWRIWIFFQDPVSARSAKYVLHNALYGNMALQTTKNGLGASKPVEIFPKRGRIGSNGLGSMVWLPFSSHTPKSHNCFFRPKNTWEFELFQPWRIIKTKWENIPDIMTKRTPNPLRAIGFKKKRKYPQMDAWREKALNNIDMRQFYVDIITGSGRDGEWVECRDPWDPSGDLEPSAAVSTGRGGIEPGQFKSRSTGKCISIFHFLMKKHDFSYSDALHWVSNYSNTPFPNARRN